eukprot:COSAG05_NODE_1129_length_5779_cov_11.914789_2_plen_120_part_00
MCVRVVGNRAGITLSKCKVGSFTAGGAEKWEAKQASNARKLAMFADILDDDASSGEESAASTHCCPPRSFSRSLALICLVGLLLHTTVRLLLLPIHAFTPDIRRHAINPFPHQTVLTVT